MDVTRVCALVANPLRPIPVDPIVGSWTSSVGGQTFAGRLCAFVNGGSLCTS
jgi:hypothetical protein